MGNCLVTQLKENVQNDNLIAIGHFRVDINTIENPSASTNYITMRFTEAATVDVIGTGKFSVRGYEYIDTDNLTHYDIPANTSTTLYFSNGDYQLDFSGKYAIFQMGWAQTNTPISFDLDNIKYATGMDGFSISNVHGDLAAMKDMSAIRNIYIYGSDLSGSIEDLYGKNLQALFLQPISEEAANYVTGNVEGLTITGNVLHIAFTNITGEISNISNIINMPSANFRRSNTTLDIDNYCSLADTYIEKSITIGRNGFIFNGNTYPLTNGNIYIYKQGNKIIVGNNGSGINASSSLFVKNATADEIAAWQAAGKTVTDVVSGTVYPPSNV